jgi:exodeoxyribonuclease VII large subunit
MDCDALLAGIAVSGEISNYKMYPSGHHYFTLKDENASLKCVMFRSSAMRLRFRPENGMKVIAMGKISVYPRDGAYQLYCSAMMIDGVGDLHAAFEQLKSKLSKEGLFDQSHKKPIPIIPQRIGVVTSSAGAALHDMLRIINARFPLANVLLFPVRVQGAEAPQEIADAITLANVLHNTDVLIVGRGGGSIEDLWAFNEEVVARAIYASEIPVISAVGHEPDVTISDYVADLRAATPSNAAELVVPDGKAFLVTMDKQQQILMNAVNQRIHAARRQLQVLSDSAVLRTPDAQIQRKRESLTSLLSGLINAQERIINECKESFVQSTAKLEAMSPLKVLQRGYSVAMNDQKQIIRSVKDVMINEPIQIAVTDGTVHAVVCNTEEESE